VIVPAVVGIAAGAVLTRVLPRPSGFGAAALSFATVSLVMLVTIVALERAGRRLLPLAALLNLSLLFPDNAPKRFAVARRVGKPRDLRRQLQEARDRGVTGGEVAHMQTVLELVAALSVHDRQTRGHSERVRVFSDLIADEMKLAPADQARLRWASLLHDIGKLVVPSEILSKPAKLTSAEMDNVRRHPDEGARIIGPLAAWLGEWADAVPHHHERFDGRGYPRGLAGDQISLAGRIVAVADSYEVMTAVRPYRKPIGVTAARQELVKCSGAQFDPVVVRAFLNISVGRLWRVVGIGSWIAQLPVIGWVDRLGWNWGAAIMSGTTAIGLTAPGLVPRPVPLPTPTSGISVVSTGTLPGQTGGSAPAAAGSGSTTGGTTSGQSTSTTPAPASGGASAPTGLPGLGPLPTPPLGGPLPSTPPIPTPTTIPTPTPTSTPTQSPIPTPTAIPSPTPTPTPPPDQPPVVTVNGGTALLGNFSGSGSFTDADFPGNTFTATVNYGDHTGTHSLPLVGMTFTLSHHYTALFGSFPITVTVTETGGLSGTGTATVTVALGL
jgi:HD-GYP domain-containing protein (c-di-GMP phosphodiesterase class II)